MSEMRDGWSVDVDGEKVVVNFPVVGDYGHRVLSRHKPAYCERSSAGSGDADASAPNTAQFAVKQVVDSTKTITVADQLHLSRFAGEIRGHYRRVVGSDGVASPDHRWVAKGTVADCATWTPPAASNRIVAQGWCGRS